MCSTRPVERWRTSTKPSNTCTSADNPSRALTPNSVPRSLMTAVAVSTVKPMAWVGTLATRRPACRIHRLDETSSKSAGPSSVTSAPSAKEIRANPSTRRSRPASSREPVSVGNDPLPHLHASVPDKAATGRGTCPPRDRVPSHTPKMSTAAAAIPPANDSVQRRRGRHHPPRADSGTLATLRRPLTETRKRRVRLPTSEDRRVGADIPRNRAAPPDHPQ